MSSYRWELYGINQIVGFETLIVDEFEEELNGEDIVDIKEYESLDSSGEYIRSDDLNTIRYNCIKLNSLEWQVVVVNCESTENAIMALCFNDSDIQARFLQLFKEMIGCVCWRIYFNWEDKLNILDSSIDGSHWYDTIFQFNGKSEKFEEENRLNRWNIRINKYDCERLGRSYSDVIIPYIELQSGIKFSMANNRSIILRMYLTIRNKDIITIKQTIPISLIISQFK